MLGTVEEPDLYPAILQMSIPLKSRIINIVFDC
jgi:hypothetical protein